jgi:hypothetical protein
MPKKKDEYPEIKDTSRPSRDAVSMKETTGQSQAEWEAIKARGKPTDEEYEARYQSLLKRYNISPDNYKTSESGAAEYTESTKQEPKSKTKPKTEKSKTSPTKEQKKTTSTSPLKSTQTSKTGSNIPPKKEVKEPPKKGNKTHPVGGWKEENQDVNNINNSRAKTMLYNDRVKLKIQKERPKSSSFTGAKTTVASLRNEYQQELIKKHKKEMAGLGTDKPQVKKQKSTESKKPQSKSLSIASLRNEYQQELIKKHKKEMAK